MANNVTTIEAMTKSVWLQLRITEELKAAIEAAAKRDGRTMSNWLLYAASMADPGVAKASGIIAASKLESAIIAAKQMNRPK